MTFCWVSGWPPVGLWDFLDFLAHTLPSIAPTERGIKVKKSQKLRAQWGDCSAICLQSLMIIFRVKMVRWKKICERLVTPVKHRLLLALMCPGVGCQKAHTIKAGQWLALFSSEVAIRMCLAQLRRYLLLETAKTSLVLAAFDLICENVWLCMKSFFSYSILRLLGKDMRKWNTSPCINHFLILKGRGKGCWLNINAA